MDGHLSSPIIATCRRIQRSSCSTEAPTHHLERLPEQGQEDQPVEDREKTTQLALNNLWASLKEQDVAAEVPTWEVAHYDTKMGLDGKWLSLIHI